MNNDRTTWLGLMTAGQALDLRTEAASAGDLALVAICDDAIECDRAAQEKCLAVISDAAAMGNE